MPDYYDGPADQHDTTVGDNYVAIEHNITIDIHDILDRAHEFLHKLGAAAGVHHHHRGTDDIIVCTANCADDKQPLVAYDPTNAVYFGPRKHDHDTRGSDRHA